MCALVIGCTDESSVWGESSRSIELECGSFFTGSMRFQATREQLIEAELSLLSSLELTDGDGSCPEDIPSCAVTITDADARKKQYDAIYEDYDCGGQSRLISWDSLQAFLTPLACSYAKGGDTTLVPDERCLNGLFATPSRAIERQLEINEGETLHLELDDCANPNRVGHVKLELFTVDRVASIAEGTPVADPGPNDACLSLEVTAPQHPILSVTVDQSFLPLGDFYVRFW